VLVSFLSFCASACAYVWLLDPFCVPVCNTFNEKIRIRIEKSTKNKIILQLIFEKLKPYVHKIKNHSQYGHDNCVQRLIQKSFSLNVLHVGTYNESNDCILKNYCGCGCGSKVKLSHHAKGASAGTQNFHKSLAGIPFVRFKKIIIGGHRDPVQKSMPP